MSLVPIRKKPQASNTNQKIEPLFKPTVQSMYGLRDNSYSAVQRKENGTLPNGKDTLKAERLSEVANKNAQLTKDERVELRRITGNRIDKAYTDYVDAAGQVQTEIHEAAKAQIEFVSFLAEIALGIMLPGAGNALAKWANNIPSSASNATFRTAFALLDQSRTSAYLTAGTKIGTNALKKSYKNLSGLDKTDAFIAKLKQNTREGFDKTDSNLPNLSDQELASVYIAFSTKFTNAVTYRTEISKMVKRFKKQILTIGNYTSRSTTSPASETSFTTGLYWVEYEPKKIVLANVTLKQKKNPTRSTGTQESTRITFNSLIDKDLGALAEKVGKAEQNGRVKRLNYSKIKQLKSLGLVSNYPQKFPSNKYYKTIN